MEQTYEEFIQNILDTRGRHGCGDEYHEEHHIKPKCMNGTNDEDNLIDLFAREHFIAHKLLAEENPDNNKLTYAWWRMCNRQNYNKDFFNITPEEYEEAKIALSNVAKSRTGKDNPNYGNHKLAGKNHPMYGNHKFAGKNNPNYGNYWTEEQRKKHSDKLSGENHPMYGKTHSEETKKKQSEAAKLNWEDAEIRTTRSKAYRDAWTNERKEKYSKSKNGGNNHYARKVIRLLDNKIYECMKYAYEDNNMSRSAMYERCKKRKEFMYYDEWLTQQNDYEDKEASNAG